MLMLLIVFSCCQYLFHLNLYAVFTPCLAISLHFPPIVSPDDSVIMALQCMSSTTIVLRVLNPFLSIKL